MKREGTLGGLRAENSVRGQRKGRKSRKEDAKEETKMGERWENEMGVKLKESSR